MPNPRPAGTTRTETLSPTEQAIRAAHRHLDRCGLEMGPRKINRLIRRFERRVLKNGWTFHEFIANGRQLSVEQRRRAVADPELACLLPYLDPVGECVAFKVDADRET